MAKTKSDSLSETKKLMAALVRMPPKPHEDMKVGKPKPKTKRGKKPSN